MFNFDYYNPTRILFGEQRIPQLGQLIEKQARVLMLYGGNSAEKNGTLCAIREELKHQTLIEFGGIEPNPCYEPLLDAIALAKEQHIDFLLAVGGGSIIDACKFVAAAAVSDVDPWQLVERRGGTISRTLPFGVVLTLPATGSEMNCAAVITRRSTQTKLPFRSPHLFPQFAILEPSRTTSLPPRQIANGIVDAFTHIVEQYLTYPVDGRVQDRFAEGLLQTLIEVGPRTLADANDLAARANMMWAASQALNGLIGAGVPQDWATHMIGHELTALYDIDHARTLAIVLPAMLQVRREEKREKLLQYAERVWQLHNGTEDERIEGAIRHTRNFFESLGIPTRLSAYGLDDVAIESVIASLAEHHMTQLGEHRSVTLDVSRAVLQAAR